MQLGIIAGPQPDSFRYAKELGLEFLEFCINIGEDVDAFAAGVPALKKASSDTGVGVGSIGRWGSDRIDKSGAIIEQELQNSYKLIDAASELGCSNFVCGINYVEELSYYDNCSAAIAFLSKLIEYGKSKGVTISTYNCHWNSFINDHMSWTLIHGHLPELGIKYDTSHAMEYGQNYLKEMRDWGSRFKHLHIKGRVSVDGKRFDDPPAGMDQTDWGAFFAILYAHKYDGTLSLEPHSHTWTGELGEKGVKFSIDFINKFLFK